MKTTRVSGRAVWSCLLKRKIHSRLSFTRSSKSVEVTWNRSENANFHFSWLRYHCLCEDCIDPSSGQRLQQCGKESIPKDVSVEDNDLHIIWKDGHQSKFSPQWLRRYSYSDQAQTLRRGSYTKNLWDGSSHPPKERLFVSYADLQSETQLFSWMQNLFKDGISFISDTPVPNGMESLIKRMGPFRSTMYGDVFDVQSVDNSINIAYTNKPLAPHMDILYYETPPGIQFLHCLHNTEVGGENYFVDSFKVAEDLRKEKPEMFRLLSKHKICFHKQGKDHWRYFPRKILDVDHETQKLEQVNWSPAFEGPWSDIPYNDMEAYLAAYHEFQRRVALPRYIFRHKLRNAEMTVFMNRRILHARAHYQGKRHLKGAYLDLDDFGDTFRVFQRKFQDATPEFPQSFV
eukprot:TRINITY_DN20041_c0_g1_i1.p1 TRINITY_DN20041_c0_g1~~TRINITY_DN20041_c0_g1_i1.p1  ORF type:complete len:409 (-),score=28.34 TRINITY_DN20041_c0_g1_i1:198-1403(-)